MFPLACYPERINWTRQHSVCASANKPQKTAVPAVMERASPRSSGAATASSGAERSCFSAACDLSEVSTGHEVPRP